MSRKDLLLSIDFFSDKELLVDEILKFEKQGLVSLPTNCKYKQTLPVELGETNVSLIRISDFYALELTKSEASKYQLFSNEDDLRTFLSNNATDDTVAAFWSRRLELICD